MSPLSAACRDSIDIFCCEQEFGAVAPRQSADLIWLMLQISSSAVKKKPQWAPNYNTDAWAVQYTTLMGEWQFGDYLKMSVFVSRAQFSCQWASQSLPGQSHHWKLWWSTLAKKKKKKTLGKFCWVGAKQRLSLVVENVEFCTRGRASYWRASCSSCHQRAFGGASLSDRLGPIQIVLLAPGLSLPLCSTLPCPRVWQSSSVFLPGVRWRQFPRRLEHNNIFNRHQKNTWRLFHLELRIHLLTYKSLKYEWVAITEAWMLSCLWFVLSLYS